MMTPYLLLFLLIPLANSQNISYDQTVLLSLKQHWGNPPSLASWNSLSSACDWPEVHCNSSTIISLSITEKNINGTIPSSICQLQNLVRIDLSKNNLSGQIPTCLDNCSNLERLDLSMNELSGTIPRELFVMQKLWYLNITSNRLFGGIPTPIRAYNLLYIDLSYNNFSGSIPDNVRNLTSLIRLDLSMNSVSGDIPSGLFNIPQLNYMSLAYNNLTGAMPALLGLLNLQELNLTHNHLNGTIPGSLGYLRPLTLLDVSHNQLSGDILQNIYPFRSKKVVRICSNRFLGQIPLEFVNEAFQESCVDRSNLCSDNNASGLPRCPVNLCFSSTIQPFLNCNVAPDKNRTAITVGAVSAGVVGFALLVYLARKCWKKARRNKKLFSTSELNDENQEWEMISFQTLDFNKSDILLSLTDENLVGKGGSGKVYRVAIEKTGYTVAVKSIWNDKKTDERLDKEFMAEIQTLGTIWHSNIVRLLCYISGKSTQLLVYQYFENKSLDQWLHDDKRKISPSDDFSITKLDWPMRLHIAIGVAQGLCYMHHHCSPPIIHRDIKSSNILLDSEFNAKIADFGLAKMLTRNEDNETVSTVAGTFGYIAPEYAYTKKVNVKSDVYSFGVILLELTTGRKAVRPGDHLNIAGWAQMHYWETSYIVDSLDDEIKESTNFLDQIVAVFRLGVICTTKTPAKRPSMRDCLNILHDFSNHLSSSDTKP